MLTEGGSSTLSTVTVTGAALVVWAKLSVARASMVWPPSATPVVFQAQLNWPVPKFQAATCQGPASIRTSTVNDPAALASIVTPTVPETVLPPTGFTMLTKGGALFTVTSAVSWPLPVPSFTVTVTVYGLPAALAYVWLRLKLLSALSESVCAPEPSP